MKNKLLIFLFLAFCIPNLTAQCDPDNEPPIFLTADTTIFDCRFYGALEGVVPDISDNCDDAPTLVLVAQTINDQAECGNSTYPIGISFVNSTWVATDASGNVATETLVTGVSRPIEFSFPIDITWTEAEVAANPGIISPNPLTEDMTTTGSGRPNLEGQLCNYAISSLTETLATCSDAFVHLQRTWTVLNWCTNSLISEDADGNDNIQNIFIGDPVSGSSPIAVCQDTLNIDLFPLDNDGDGFPDECVINLTPFDFNDGSSDEETADEDLLFYFNNNPAEVSLVLSSDNLGENNILLYVQNENGCVSSCTTVLNLNAPDGVPCAEIAQCENGTVPTAVCVSGLVFEFLALDTDGDGQPDDCIYEIFATDLNAGSSDNETAAEDLIYYFNDSPEETSMVFTGANLGVNEILLYVQDEDGCIATCFVNILLTAPSNVPCSSGLLDMNGQVETILGAGIKDVEMTLGNLMTLTDENGSYEFPETIDPSSSGGTFTISCYKNNNAANGVTNTDLLIIKQHILTINPITNPVYLLAADVNGSGTITAADMVAIKQVILSVTDEFPNNNSWRFFTGDINGDFSLDSYSFTLNNGNEDINIDWTGYKVGDVNGSAVPE